MQRNEQLFRIVGLSRSGNHAVINWMLAQLNGSWLFLNCVEPKADPLRTARPMDDGRTFLASEPAAVDAARRDVVLFSQEDTFLNPALGEAATRLQEAALGGSRKRLDVVVLRDPFNLMASRRKLGCAAVSEQTAVRIWKQHAKAVLAGRSPAGGPLVGVDYDRWFSEAAYRRALSARLGLTFSDAGLDEVARCGGGSSFDRMGFHGRARDMAVLDRWRSYQDDASFWALFDAGTLKLCERLYAGAPLAEPMARARGGGVLAKAA